MIEHRLVKLACSEWTSNVVMVRKGEETLRFCVDYRQLNERTRKDSNPLPRIDVSLDAGAGQHGSLLLTCVLRGTIR